MEVDHFKGMVVSSYPKVMAVLSPGNLRQLGELPILVEYLASSAQGCLQDAAIITVVKM